MRRFLFVLFSCSLIFSACRNDKLDWKIEGKISDLSFNSALSGADVKLSSQEVNGGVFSAGYSTVAEASTVSDGSYELEFERENVPDYRLSVSKDGYFSDELSINPDDLSPDESFTQNMSLRARADVTFRLINSQPGDEQDKIIIQNLNANFECACCNGEERQFTGVDVDTTIG
ncbi:MAG: carboxypeptidase regulatory-like domain-containing protein, partial [Flavobacteriales bacterium]|nr:carboxypeptidase regulatory-like domain-containing protein [Flavobacteriales bacterium]